MAVRIPALYRRLFWPILAPSLLLGVASGATIPVQIIAAMRLGASASLAALIVAILGAIGLAWTIPAGRLIDRLGDRRAMLVATVVVAISTVATITSLVWHGHGHASLWLYMAAAFLRSPAADVWSLARQAFTADHVEPRQGGQAMTALGGTMRIGNLVGPLVGGLLLMVLPLWSVFVLSLLCAVLALVIVYIPALGGRLDDVAPHHLVGLGKASSAGAPRGTSAPREQVGQVGSGVRWGAVVLAGIAIVALSVARVAQPVLVQLWGVHSGLGESSISLLVAVGAAIEIVLMFPGGYLKDRLGRAVILVVCLLVYGTGFLLIVPLSHLLGVAGMVLAIVVMAVGNGLGAGVNMTIGADLSPTVGRARFLGIWALFSNVGVLGGPALISLLVGVASVQAAIISIGGITLAGAAWMVVFAGRIGLPGRAAPR